MDKQQMSLMNRLQLLVLCPLTTLLFISSEEHDEKKVNVFQEGYEGHLFYL